MQVKNREAILEEQEHADLIIHSLLSIVLELIPKT